jgi:hypothetical protein
MGSPTSSQGSALSSALTDSNDFFDRLRNAKDLIAAYRPSSSADYTARLLNAILDSRGIIEHSGVQNVLEDIHNHRDDPGLAHVAVHYMTSIFSPRTATPPLSESSRLTPPSQSQGHHPFSATHGSTWWI